jgi:hypothetical protein
VKRGPSADATWEYYPSRQAHPADDGAIQIEIGRAPSGTRRVDPVGDGRPVGQPASLEVT